MSLKNSKFYFSENLQYLIKQHGINNSRLEKSINSYAYQVQKYIDGTLPRADNLVKIARFFHVTVDDLLFVNLNESETFSCRVLFKKKFDEYIRTSDKPSFTYHLQRLNFKHMIPDGTYLAFQKTDSVYWLGKKMSISPELSIFKNREFILVSKALLFTTLKRIDPNGKRLYFESNREYTFKSENIDELWFKFGDIDLTI